MTVKEITIINQVGLHARPAVLFCTQANMYSELYLWLEKGEKRVNARSILGILSLGIVGGNTIRIIADGEKEKEAIEALSKLIENGFED